MLKEFIGFAKGFLGPIAWGVVIVVVFWMLVNAINITVGIKPISVLVAAGYLLVAYMLTEAASFRGRG